MCNTMTPKERAEQHLIAARIEGEGLPWELFASGASLHGKWIKPTKGNSPAAAIAGGCAIRIAEPPTQIPLERNDWIVGGPWFVLEPGTNRLRSIVLISNTEISWGGAVHYHKEAMSMTRTNDGINFHPCSKLAK